MRLRRRSPSHWALLAALGQLAARAAVGGVLAIWVGVETTLGFARPTRALNLATAVAVAALAAVPFARS